MKLVYLILFVAFIPLASASFDCHQIPEERECLTLQAINESLISTLLYNNASHPDHDFVSEYNARIRVNAAPEGYRMYDSGVIRNAWLAMLTIEPSVVVGKYRFTPSDYHIRSEYDYDIQVPENYYNPERRNGAICKVMNSLDANAATLSKLADSVPKAQGKDLTVLNYRRNVNWTDQLDIRATVKRETYEWQRYCCQRGGNGCIRYCFRCALTGVERISDSLRLTDSKYATYYSHSPNVSFSLLAEYEGTHKGRLSKDNQTNLWLGLGQSQYSNQVYLYSAEFINKPFYMLQIQAAPVKMENSKNIFWANDTFYVANASNCHTVAEDFFLSQTRNCTTPYDEHPSAGFVIREPSANWSLLLKLLVLAGVGFLLYTILRKYWAKIFGVLIVLVLALPTVHAEEECDLLHLATCIPQKLYEFTLSIINSPIEPLLNWIKSLLETAPSIDPFHGVWAIIVYCLSLFFGLLFLYSGYQFLMSGHNVLKREMAKEWLKNTIIMIVLIQASFYLYGLVADLGATMTSAVLSLVNPHFFLLTADNIVNIGLQLLFVGAYLLVLFLTLLMLVSRYLIVAFDVLFAPIGIFCYFIPPLKSYGKLILNILGMSIFIVFLDAIVILACSMLITIPFFENIKILVMINCFAIINFLFFILMKHVIQKSSIGDGAENLAQAAKYVVMFA